MPDAATYQAQHKRRLSYMPWLYYRLKPKHLQWAAPWQAELQAQLCELETVQLGRNVFIAPEARLFAEPGRPIIIGDNTYIAADAVLHGPITLGDNVSVNHHASLDGGRAGIVIGDGCRLAAYSALYAFNHGLSAHLPIREQPVSSNGICLEADVWLGSHAGVVDGVTMHQGAVAGMQAVVTRDVTAYTIVAGNPAQPIGERRKP
jgi:acetyltransferase-like isoleucine patch superfamily enzyme